MRLVRPAAALQGAGKQPGAVVRGACIEFAFHTPYTTRPRQVLRVPPSRNLVDCRRRSRAQAGARREGARRGTPGRRRLRARCLPDLENQTLVREALVPPRRRRRCRAAVTAGARDVPAAEEMRLRRHVLLVVDHDEPVDRCWRRRQWRCRRRRRNWFLVEQAASGPEGGWGRGRLGRGWRGLRGGRCAVRLV